MLGLVMVQVQVLDIHMIQKSRLSLKIKILNIKIQQSRLSLKTKILNIIALQTQVAKLKNQYRT